jgi:hypothetical protein
MKRIIKKIVKSIKKGVRGYMNKEKKMFETRVEAFTNFMNDDDARIKTGVVGIMVSVGLIASGVVGKCLKTA